MDRWKRRVCFSWTSGNVLLVGGKGAIGEQFWGWVFVGLLKMKQRILRSLFPLLMWPNFGQCGNWNYLLEGRWTGIRHLYCPPLFVRGSSAHMGQKKGPSHFVRTNFANSQAHRPYKYLLNLPHSIQGHCLLLRPPAPEELCSSYHLPPFLEVEQGITKKELGEEGHGRWVGGSAIWRIDSCIVGTLWGTGFSAPPGHTRFLKRLSGLWSWST